MPLYVALSALLLLAIAVAILLPPPAFLQVEDGVATRLRRAGMALGALGGTLGCLTLAGVLPVHLLTVPAAALAGVGYALWLISMWLPGKDDGEDDEPVRPDAPEPDDEAPRPTLEDELDRLLHSRAMRRPVDHTPA